MGKKHASSGHGAHQSNHQKTPIQGKSTNLPNHAKQQFFQSHIDKKSLIEETQSTDQLTNLSLIITTLQTLQPGR